MKNKRLVKSVSYSLFAFLFVLIGLSQQVNADTITAGSGNRIHFINTKAKSGSDAILLESNGHWEPMYIVTISAEQMKYSIVIKLISFI